MTPSELPLATTRRQIIWRGDARPRLGLMLPAADEIDFARDPQPWERRWRLQLERTAELGLGAAALPPFFPNAESALQQLAAKAHELNLLLAIPTKLEWLTHAASAKALSRIANVHPASFLLVPLSANDEPHAIEDRFHEQQRSEPTKRTPVAFTGNDALGSGCASLLNYGASTLFVDGVELLSALPAATLLATLLAGRPETHPGLSVLRRPDAATLGRQTLAALSSGHALILGEAPWEENALPEGFAAKLQELQTTLGELPPELAPPLDAPLKVWLDAPSAERNPSAESVAGAVEVLHRAGFGADVLHAHALDRRARSSALWVPSHGPISSETWTALWSLAHRGASVMITGFAFDDEARERMTRLFTEPGAGKAPTHEAPAWLQLRQGSGSFVFSKHRPELQPEAEESREFVARFARWAELPQCIEEPAGLERLLRLGTALALHVRLDAPSIRVCRT